MVPSCSTGLDRVGYGLHFLSGGHVMRHRRALLALVMSLVTCPGLPEGSVAADIPVWQQGMDDARRNAAAGKTFDLLLTSPDPAQPGSVHVFYNNPDPLCYMFMIPGNWRHAGGGYFRSTDGRSGAGVLFAFARSLEGLDGTNLVERAHTALIRWHEKQHGQRLPSTSLVPFDSAPPGTWKLLTPPIKQGDLVLTFPTRIIVDLTPHAVAHVTVEGTGDDDGLARRIIASLRTTSSPECYWSLLEAMLKALYGEK